MPTSKRKPLTLDQLRILQQVLIQPHGFASFGVIQEWIATTFWVQLSYNAMCKLVRYELGAKLKVLLPSHKKSQGSPQPSAPRSPTTCAPVPCHARRRRLGSERWTNVDWFADHLMVAHHHAARNWSAPINMLSPTSTSMEPLPHVAVIAIIWACRSSTQPSSRCFWNHCSNSIAEYSTPDLSTSSL